MKLLELSLDVELAYNAVELVLESPDLLPDVSIHEVEVCDVVVLFGTSTTVYRLTLPHPARIKQVQLVSRSLTLVALVHSTSSIPSRSQGEVAVSLA